MLEETRAGPVLRVKVRPRASRDAVVGIDAGALRVSVRAAPERGKANDAVCKAIASWLGLRARDVSLVSGDATRDKRVLVQGIDVETLRARLRDFSA